MKHNWLLLAFFTLVFTGPLSAQITWKNLNGPTGVTEYQLQTIDTAGQLFLTVGDSLYISSDKGTSWRLSNNGFAAADLLDFRFITSFPSGKIIARAGDSYYRYQPATDDWQLQDTSLFRANGTFFSFDTSGVFWFRNNDYDLCFSLDEGVTYEIVSFGFSDLKSFAPYSADFNLALRNFSVYNYNETGAIGGYGTFVSVLNVAINPYSGVAFINGPLKNYRSLNQGSSWIEFEIDPDLPTNYLDNMIFVSDTEIWANGYYHLFRSLDGGETWTKIFTDLNTPRRLKRDRDGSLYLQHPCINTLNVGRSDDGGQTWTDIATKTLAPSVDQLQATTYGNLYAQQCGRYQGSADGGRTWHKIIITDSAALEVRYLVALPDGTLFGISDKMRVMKSLDGGATWAPTAQPDAGAPLGYSDMSIFEKDFYNNLVLCTKKGSFVSSNKGQSWKKIGLVNVPNNNYGTDVVFGPEGNVYTQYIWFYPQRVIQYYDPQIDTMVQVDFPAVAGLDNLIFSYSRAFITPTGEFYCWGYAENLHKSLVFKKLPNTFAFEYLTSFTGDKILGMAASAYGETFVATQDYIYATYDGGLSWNNLGGHARPVNSFIANVDPRKYILLVGADQYLYEGFYGRPLSRSAEPLATKNLITGQVWFDNDGDCLWDATEIPAANATVVAGGITSVTNTDGRYTMRLPAGDYAVHAYTEVPLWIWCNEEPVSFASNTDSVNIDLGLKKTADCHLLRVEVNHPPLRRCLNSRYVIYYQNEGSATAENALLTVVLDPLFMFENASLPLLSQVGDTCRFALGDLAPGHSGQMYFDVFVTCEVVPGESYCLNATLTPANDCAVPLRTLNEDKACQVVTGSFDPNDKRAFVDGNETFARVLPGKAIEYNIRFQNTGNDTAFTVVVKDRISEHFDLRTITNILASHPYEVRIDDDRVLVFTFPNILLPDSNVNEVASHGFVQFLIRPNDSTALGTELVNSADIYFDFNAPVVTNESKLTISLVSKTSEALPGYSLSAYPNPFQQSIRLNIDGPGAASGHYRLVVMDALGRQVAQQSFSGDSTLLNTQSWPAGLYYVSMMTEKGRVIGHGKIVRME